MTLVVTCCLLFFGPALSLAPTSAALRAKYGAPIQSPRKIGPLQESFAVRPGIEVLVTYGKERRACVLELSRINSHEVIDDTTLVPLLNELAPEAGRGKKQGEGSYMTGLGGFKTAYFQNMDIDRFISSEPQPHFTYGPSAVIRFREEGCPPRQ